MDSLIQCVKNVCIQQQYSARMIDKYCAWTQQFCDFMGDKAAANYTKLDVMRFLNHLAEHEHVSLAAQKQALGALRFLFSHLLFKNIDAVQGVRKAEKGRRTLTILDVNSVNHLMAMFSHQYWLVVQLMYSAGLRLRECVRLKVNDIDFERGIIIVPGTNVKPVRKIKLPHSLLMSLRVQIQQSTMQNEPRRASKRLGFTHRQRQEFVFVSNTNSKQHLSEYDVMRAVHFTAKKAGYTSRVTPHTFRHSCIAHLLNRGFKPCTIRMQLDVEPDTSLYSDSLGSSRQLITHGSGQACMSQYAFAS